MTENNLKAFALQSGIKKLWKELSEAEKTQVRYNYMLEKTSFFAGDAERTIGSTANQMKVLKARLGDLYQQVGGQLEPAWNDFLGTLVDSIEEIVATEEATKGLATTLETILDGANIAISGIKNLIVWYQKFSGAIGNPFEKTMIDKQFEEIKKSNSDFLKDKEDLFKKEEKIEKRRLEAKKSWDLNYHKAVKLSKEQVKGLHQELIDLEKEKYENRQSIIEAYETYEIEAYDRMVTNTKTAFEEMINASGKAKNEIGQNLIDALGFYVNFTKGMTKEIQKQIAVIGAQGAARSYIEIELKKFSDKGIKPTEKQVSDIYSKAGNLASTQYTANMKMNELKTGDQQTVMNEITSKMGYTPFEFGANKKDWVSGINNNKGLGTGTGGTGNAGTEKLTLRQLSSQYEKEKKAFEEYAKQRQLTEEEKLQGLLSIQDSYTKQAIDNKWIEYGKTLSIQANETQNKINNIEEEKKAQEEAKEKEKRLAEEQKKILDEKIKQGQELREQDKLILAQGKIKRSFEDDKTVQQLNDTYRELQNKYSDNEEILKLIDSEYETYLKNLGKEKTEKKDLADVFSETSKIAGELATLFEDDLLGAMAGLLDTAGSLAKNLSSGNVLGSISSGLALVNQLDSFLNDDGASKQQEEANTKFQEAVESFKKSVENFSLGQKISFAKLEKPSNLVGAITGTGEKGTQLWENMFTGGAASVIDMLKGDFKASNASLDTTALQQQLASAGYGGIDVNAIFGKYAQRDSYRNWYGKKESYISGYDTAGAMAEITKLIEEAWQANLEGFAQALSLSSQDFIKNMVDVFKSGGSISESVNDMFYNAVIEAFFNQELFETLNKNLSGAISEIIIGELSTEGIDLGMDFKGMTPGEMIEAYTKIYGASSDKLKEILEQLGLAASSATDQLNQVSTKNLPSGLKVSTAEFQASNASYGQTYQTIYQIENNYSKDFSEMVATAQNQSRFNQTGNARRSY